MVTSKRLRVFFDADTLIAGAASSTGASHALLRLAELGLVRGLTCRQALQEAERNLEAKLPAALPAFRAILASAHLEVVPEPDRDTREGLAGLAHEDDLPILGAALAGGSAYLTTFNVRHYHIAPDRLRVARPGELLTRLRETLTEPGESMGVD